MLIASSIQLMSTSTRTYDRETVRKIFENEGISVTDWARKRGFRREDVYAVLNGRSKGTRGKGHVIAVALGIKPKPDGNNPIAGIPQSQEHKT